MEGEPPGGMQIEGKGINGMGARGKGSSARKSEVANKLHVCCRQNGAQSKSIREMAEMEISRDIRKK